MKRYNCHGQIVKLSTLSLSKRLAKFSLALPIAFKHLHKGKHKQTNKQRKHIKIKAEIDREENSYTIEPAPYRILFN